MTQEKPKRKAVYNPEADRKWRQANPEKARYLTDRTSARRFIRKAEQEDLLELLSMIQERLEPQE